MTTTFRFVAASAVLAFAATAPAAFAQDALTPKGIFRDPGTTQAKNGVSYRVVLDSGKEVPVSHGFHSGDRLKLQVNLKDSAYVYVLNRTFDGEPKELGEKGINVVRDEDHSHIPAKPTYTLLFPGPGETPKKILAGKFRDIPGGGALQMDKTPGLEKLYLVVSDHPLDLQKMFPDGQLKKSSGGNRSDTSEDVIERLNKDLSDWAADTQTESAPDDSEEVTGKGIVRDNQSYTVGPRTKPIMAEITLHHSR